MPNSVPHYVPVLVEELRAILLANGDVPDIIANNVLFRTDSLQERAFGMNLGGNCQSGRQDTESHFENKVWICQAPIEGYETPRKRDLPYLFYTTNRASVMLVIRRACFDRQD